MRAKASFLGQGTWYYEVGEHEIQTGGQSGDGYCYKHQSFDCVGKLTAEEKKAMDDAEAADEMEHRA